MSEFFDTGKGEKETKKTAAFNEKHPLIVDAKKKLQAKTKALKQEQEQEQQQTDASNEPKNPMGSPDKKQEEETSARYRMKNGKFF
jgi:hypothetical protein